MLRRRKSADIEPNLTSLIDVTFLLIVFFVLVSRLNEVENVDMDLPRPANAASASLEAAQQVVVSVLPAAEGKARAYRVGVIDYPPGQAGVDAVAAHLAKLYQANPELNVNIRADRAIHYEHVEPVMQAVSTAARLARPDTPSAPTTAHVNLVVTRDE
jgi:biopolymer transport protein ExbD